MKNARLYLCVSTEFQDPARQEPIVEGTKTAGIYREKASGARADRRERQRKGVEFTKTVGKYQGWKTDTTTHQRIIALRTAGKSIAETVKLAACSPSQVKRVRRMCVQEIIR